MLLAAACARGARARLAAGVPGGALHALTSRSANNATQAGAAQIREAKPSHLAAEEIEVLQQIERRANWLASLMIHNANNVRPSRDGVKVGGHQASSASVAAILTTLYMKVLRPQDRVAVKPHAGPLYHSLQYLMGRQTLENMQNFRSFGGVQPYPSRTKDLPEVDHRPLQHFYIPLPTVTYRQLPSHIVKYY